MEQALTELKAHLMATSEEFRQLAAQHAEYDTASWMLLKRNLM